jgi:enoyl-CoA hydratase/carnithine racemase
MDDPFVVLSRQGRYARVTMNRPRRRNALSHDMLHALVDAFRELGSDAGVTGIVLAGEGPVFSAGHDFGDLAGADEPTVRAMLETCVELMRVLREVPQPVVARVHGLATAAGCQLVAAADLAVATRSAGFAVPGGRGGWFCHTPMVAVGRAVGRKHAVEMAFSGDVVDAETARAWGLVNTVVDDAELDEAVTTLLDRVTRGSTASKAIGKRTLYEQLDLPEDEAYKHAVDVMAATSQWPDAQEGMRAFLDKRPPRWESAP